MNDRSFKLLRTTQLLQCACEQEMVVNAAGALLNSPHPDQPWQNLVCFCVALSCTNRCKITMTVTRNVAVRLENLIVTDVKVVLL